jgi:hypothetical protein
MLIFAVTSVRSSKSNKPLLHSLLMEEGRKQWRVGIMERKAERNGEEK